MAELLRLPEVAAGATEAILAEWLVPEGTAFTAGEPIVAIETEKASVEVEAEVDGIILRALARPESQVTVGSPIAMIGTEADRGADIEALLAELGFSADDAARGNQPAPPRRDVPEPEADSLAPRHQDPARQDLQDTAITHQNGAEGRGGQRLFVSPLARRMLKEAGIDPADVPGSGPRGRILRRDVEQAMDSRTEPRSTPAIGTPHGPAIPAPTQQRNGVRQIEHSRLRRAIANRLTVSKQTVPHFYLKRTVRMDHLLDIRNEINGHSDSKISVNDFVLKAVSLAHTRVPEANVTWTEDATRQYEAVDVAVAIASDRGLVTPVLRDVQDASLREISAAVRSFVQAANTGKLQQKDLAGGSITVTNLGMYDVDEFTAIINPPHAAILAVGAARPTPVVQNMQVTSGTCMSLVLSVDHRAIDGALAAQWMQTLVAALQSPLSLLI